MRGLFFVNFSTQSALLKRLFGEEFFSSPSKHGHFTNIYWVGVKFCLFNKIFWATQQKKEV